RVREAIAQVGYRPDGIARSLKKGSTQTIGLLVTDITNPFFTAVVHSVEDAAQARGYSLFLCNSDESFAEERTYLDLLLTRRVDGLILVPTGKAADYAGFASALRAPVVFIDRAIPGAAVDTVTVDNLRASQAAVEDLLRLPARPSAHGHCHGPAASLDQRRAAQGLSAGAAQGRHRGRSRAGAAGRFPAGGRVRRGPVAAGAAAAADRDLRLQQPDGDRHHAGG